ncbi:MAG: diphosphomevalonate decarboxylase [Anaerolineaceae bacterium]|nr:diphosphomevalonate decarboxylase [Anaerolineaceae bacterium]
MAALSISAIAHPNIAFIKYWGNINDTLRLPANGSISMNLANLSTITSVELNPLSKEDKLTLNGEIQEGSALKRVQDYLSIVRKLYNKDGFLDITSKNNFPMSAGIASSAAAFAALSTAVAEVYALEINESELSALARLGSGSACRSIPSGYCEWKKGSSHLDSYAVTIAPASHWQLWDCIVIVESEPKDVSSTEGHHLAFSSPLQKARIENAPLRLDICRSAILNKDFEQLAEIIELDSNIMHAVMMTSNPPILYWSPTSISIMHHVRKIRKSGLAAAFTLDAGANVHIICTEQSHLQVTKIFTDFPGVKQAISSPVGSGSQLLNEKV